ncbi:probable carboxylesterase 12 [Dioscorea cayenensis subsp. rotundata]|uniref:Probable carboxylesterase 12 n=1 Tax=Dioscorea cayennensis subsp. rotundata TaxID=55577 RepID=A0AB40B8H4_DIOCR|nr:probable carboxylesterase 12 [Dioscorea cayenensis subsp. rotundata]
MVSNPNPSARALGLAHHLSRRHRLTNENRQPLAQEFVNLDRSIYVVLIWMAQIDGHSKLLKSRRYISNLIPRSSSTSTHVSEYTRAAELSVSPAPPPSPPTSTLPPASSPKNFFFSPLFLPPHPQLHSLPIILYFHGGGFCIESTTSLSSATTVLILSVDYRRAPEHLLPTAYSNSWQTLQWLTSSPQEEWLTTYADFTRFFLTGDSAGANIVHQLALRATREKLCGGPHGSPKLRGAMLIHPYF